MQKRPIFLDMMGLNQRYDEIRKFPSWIFTFDLPYPKQTFQRHVGIEIEVEDTLDIKPKGWSVEKDGSLRGAAAREYKTLMPCTCLNAFGNLDDIYSRINSCREKNPNAFKFSERTSIHVHVDVRDLTIEQIKGAMKLYMIFEKSFFDLVGRERKHNVFCIPLSDSYISAKVMDRNDWWRMWEKYCAFNAQPVASFGTLEFRQMSGNDNVELIKTWVLMLSSLIEFAKQKDLAHIEELIDSLKVESQYMQLARNIMGEQLANKLTIFPDESDNAATATKMF